MAAHARQNEPLRFDVDSNSRRGKMYLVDLELFGGRGRCDCAWFETHCGPKLKKNQEPVRYCRHIIEARQLFCRLAILAAARGLKDGKVRNDAFEV